MCVCVCVFSALWTWSHNLLIASGRRSFLLILRKERSQAGLLTCHRANALSLTVYCWTVGVCLCLDVFLGVTVCWLFSKRNVVMPVSVKHKYIDLSTSHQTSAISRHTSAADVMDGHGRTKKLTNDDCRNFNVVQICLFIFKGQFTQITKDIFPVHFKVSCHEDCFSFYVLDFRYSSSPRFVGDAHSIVIWHLKKKNKRQRNNSQILLIICG